MAVKYLNSGRQVRTNHILNPSFEIDATHWAGINANSTVEVVADRQFHGSKSLKITGNGTGAYYGAAYVGPTISVADVRAPSTFGSVSVVAYLSTDQPNGQGAIGGYLTDAANVQKNSGIGTYRTLTATPTRSSTNLDQVMYTTTNADYVRPGFFFKNSANTGPRVSYIDAVMLTADANLRYNDFGPFIWPSFIVGDRPDGEAAMDYAWTGTPHNSTSTATMLRWVNFPETGAIGQDYTVTGAGFVPSEEVRVQITRPGSAPDINLVTAANPDGTFAYTFTMPTRSGGTTTVRVSTESAQAWGEQAVTVPMPIFPPAPVAGEGEVINYFPDPEFRTVKKPTILMHNFFPNPSPTDSLTGFTPSGAATAALNPAAAIKGNGGVRVVSPSAADGVTINTAAETPGICFTVYVRAVTAGTITGSISADYALWTDANIPKGWGDFGWGEPFSYVEGASHTFAAGEVKRFRVYANVLTVGQGGTYSLGVAPAPVDYRLTLKGAGTFDVDAVWMGDGVDDGVDPATYPGGSDQIPNAPLYFDGDTPDTEEFVYSWDGTPRASMSTKSGYAPQFFTTENSSYAQVGYDNARTAILTTGENGVAIQSDWWMNQSSFGDLTAHNESPDLKWLGLTPGKKYVLALDIVSTYENYVEGYIGDLWDTFYLMNENGTSNTGTTMPAVMRRRLHLPLIPDEFEVNVNMGSYRNWVTGETFLTNVSLSEVEFVAPTWSPAGTAAALPLDLFAHGLEPGKSYITLLDSGLWDPTEFYRVEYQSPGTAGGWFPLVEHLYDPAFEAEYFRDEFTVPADATALRFSASAEQLYFDAEFFSKPPDYFNGDMPDGGGYAYSWAGTPWQSASLRTAAGPALQGQVFVGGTAVSISEMRVMVTGTLTPVLTVGAA